jgi:uracil-xanthine permease
MADADVEKVADAEVGEKAMGCDACMITPDMEGILGLKSYPWGYLCMPQLPFQGPVKIPEILAPGARLPLLLSVVMGLQHALAMLGGIITPPSLISGDACFPWQKDQELCDSKAYMISSALIASGILSIVQILRCRLPGGYALGTGLISVVGPSFTFLPLAREVVVGSIQEGESGMDGYGKFLGTCLVAAFLEIGLSFIPPRLLKKAFPPVVTGTCVTLIGAGLSVAGMKYWGGGVFCAENDLARGATFGGPQVCEGNGDVILGYGAPEYIGLGCSVIICLITLQMFGSPFMKNCSVAFALLFGYFVAGVSSYTPEGATESLGFVNDKKVEDADVLTFIWATTFNLGFYPPAFIPLLISFVVTTVETIGDIQASCDVSGLPTEGEDADSRIQGGLLADGVNSVLAVLFTTPPNTTFSQNNGVIAITRCASRSAGIACGIWLILFGIFAKFGAFIASIPDCVLGGMTTFLFANVLVSGINILAKGGVSSRRSRFIVALSLGIGMGVAAMPNWAEGGGLASYYGKNLQHTIGIWPARDVCEVFPKVSVTVTPASCTVGSFTSAAITTADCTGLGGTFTEEVTEMKETKSCDGKNGRCCLKYDNSKKMWRDSLIIILKTPYCIGTLLALFLNSILPYEVSFEEDTAKEVTL